jgi:mannose-6-phosphate isomerase-like protein (cupin superfamily)
MVSPDDPDDHRPNSEWALAVDPIRSDGRYVRTLGFLFERLAVGDSIPLHTHAIDEAIFIEEGEVQAVLGDETRLVSTGALIFIPAGIEHCLRNESEQVARIHGVFPADAIDIRYVERNPAPGTESDEPRPPFVINLREV